ncbi:hypothetical protein ACFZAR_42905 [Streptomyces sp. NPDC008222]|uniref:hypothetical protein n=1 Tax=Streptomyces sp. NPDC008222 TaxID=3364820 RepID=UPI0036E3439C
MPSGGARARSGPAPDPNALRRERDAGEWTTLPAEGRQGATPGWPLTDQTIRESTLWERLWRMPQALMWERYGQEIEVALYVRRLSEAEELESKVTLSTLVRQMADSLGLTTPGLRANRWRIVRDEVADRRESTAAAAAPVKKRTARDRFKVVSGDGGGE